MEQDASQGKERRWWRRRRRSGRLLFSNLVALKSCASAVHHVSSSKSRSSSLAGRNSPPPLMSLAHRPRSATGKASIKLGSARSCSDAGKRADRRLGLCSRAKGGPDAPTARSTRCAGRC